jgi:co-chaperonin GroES (HSP10)
MNENLTSWDELEPLGERILVERHKLDVRSKSGLYLGPALDGFISTFAKVLAVGPGVKELRVGNEVMLTTYVRNPVDYTDETGEKHTIELLGENEVLAIRRGKEA